MTREQALKSAEAYFDDGHFLEDLKRRVAIKTESQIYECRKIDMNNYMDEMALDLLALLALQCLGTDDDTVAVIRTRLLGSTALPSQPSPS